MREGTLIVKLGSAGDVVRTTPLLRVLRGPVTWVTEAAHAPLLPKTPALRVLTPERSAALRGKRFRQILCLDDSPRAAEIASMSRARRRDGAIASVDGVLGYTKSARGWFDMGLLSRLGARKADALKKSNALSYQRHLFRLAGFEFSGEEYWIAAPPRRAAARGTKPRVGLEARVGERWPAKAWSRYDELERALRARGVRVTRFTRKPDISSHIAAVDACDAVVSGDTLTMHLALALRKPTVALFTCTPPQEIEDYGRLVKIVSPGWKKFLFLRRPSVEASSAIPLAPVLEETLNALRSG